MSVSNLALQTWTIRRLLETEPLSTLRAVHDIGFKYLELAGNAGRSPADFSKICREEGFTVIGVHQPPLTTGDLKDLIEETVEACEAYKCTYATVMIDPVKAGVAQGRGSRTSYCKYADLASEAGEALRGRGITLCYHCFSHDLEGLEGGDDSKSGLDILLEQTSGDHLAFQLDTYFLFKAGMPVEWFLEKCGSRCEMVHVNDIDEEGGQAVLGDGTIPWENLLKLVQRRSSPTWYILEHTCDDPLRWIGKSYSYWRKHIVAT